MRAFKSNSIIHVLIGFVLIIVIACSTNQENKHVLNFKIKSKHAYSSKAQDTLHIIQMSCNAYAKHYYNCFKTKPDTVFVLENNFTKTLIPFLNTTQANQIYWKYTCSEQVKSRITKLSPAINVMFWCASEYPEVMMVSFFPGFKHQADFHLVFRKNKHCIETDTQETFLYKYHTDSIIRIHQESQTRYAIPYKATS